MRFGTGLTTIGTSAVIAISVVAGPLAGSAAASDPGDCGIVIQMCDGLYSGSSNMSPGSGATPPARSAVSGYSSKKRGGKKHRRRHGGGQGQQSQ